MWALPTFRFIGLCISKPWGSVWVQMNHQGREGELGDGIHSPNQQQSFASQRVMRDATPMSQHLVGSGQVFGGLVGSLENVRDRGEGPGWG